MSTNINDRIALPPKDGWCAAPGASQVVIFPDYDGVALLNHVKLP